MQELNLKPTHKLVKSYYETLGQYGQLSIDHEMAVRSAFQALLCGCGRQFEWTLVPEWKIQRPKAGIIKIDGAMVDTFRLARGFWEAKDEHDDLEREIRAKLDKGYPRDNIIFQAPERAVLIQNGVRQKLNEDIRDGGNLVELLNSSSPTASRTMRSGTRPLPRLRSAFRRLPKGSRRRSKSSGGPILRSSNASTTFTRCAASPSIPICRWKPSRRCWSSTC